eukprot:TRINITY_DN3890_c0_g1_i1.p1 TRINITY_DN3890_c0_g1~~TRINITY_DN3890_c0_g1_i1.p1  ORF type:complete len:517 (+),score=27.30 TRINITY_DN3890_c0_g1_i1:317-1867(+)
MTEIVKIVREHVANGDRPISCDRSLTPCHLRQSEHSSGSNHLDDFSTVSTPAGAEGNEEAPLPRYEDFQFHIDHYLREFLAEGYAGASHNNGSRWIAELAIARILMMHDGFPLLDRHSPDLAKYATFAVRHFRHMKELVLEDGVCLCSSFYNEALRQERLLRNDTILESNVTDRQCVLWALHDVLGSRQLFCSDQPIPSSSFVVGFPSFGISETRRHNAIVSENLDYVMSLMPASSAYKNRSVLPIFQDPPVPLTLADSPTVVDLVVSIRRHDEPVDPAIVPLIESSFTLHTELRTLVYTLDSHLPILTKTGDKSHKLTQAEIDSGFALITALREGIECTRIPTLIKRFRVKNGSQGDFVADFLNRRFRALRQMADIIWLNKVASEPETQIEDDSADEVMTRSEGSDSNEGSDSAPLHDANDTPVPSRTQCGKCSDSIGNGNFLEAFGTVFHIECFTCPKCGQQIGTGRYVGRNGAPFHPDCAAMADGGTASGGAGGGGYVPGQWKASSGTGTAPR